MITISHIPQNNSFSALHAASGQFDPGHVSGLSPDRQVGPQVMPCGPMPPITGLGITFEEAAERYFREDIERNRSPRGQDFVRSLLRSRIYPTFAHRPLD
jgi:hypothetical protein